MGAFSSSACSTIGSYILIYVFFHLHSRWESSTFPPDQPLGQNITCATSSAGSFLLFLLIHRWVTKVLYNLIRFHSRWEFPPLLPDPPLGHISLVKHNLLSQLLGVSSSSACSTIGLYKSRPCRFNVGASQHTVTPEATRRHCIGLAVESLFADMERLTLCPHFRGAARSLLASGEGRKRKVTSNQTPHQHTLRINSHLAGFVTMVTPRISSLSHSALIRKCPAGLSMEYSFQTTLKIEDKTGVGQGCSLLPAEFWQQRVFREHK